jgi:hypothetical protein
VWIGASVTRLRVVFETENKYSSADPRKGTLLKIGKQRISVVVSGKQAAVMMMLPSFRR